MTVQDKVRALIRSARAVGEDIAVELIIDAVVRGVGKTGGRPRNEVSKPVISEKEPVISETEPVSEVFQLPASSDLRQEEKNTTSAEVPADSVLTFPTSGKVHVWHLTQPFVDECKASYPGLDVMAECKKAKLWAEANPKRRKTAQGMRNFLANWLARVQDRGVVPAQERRFNSGPPSVGPVRRDIGEVLEQRDRCNFHRESPERISPHPVSWCRTCQRAKRTEAPSTIGELLNERTTTDGAA